MISAGVLLPLAKGPQSLTYTSQLVQLSACRESNAIAGLAAHIIIANEWHIYILLPNRILSPSHDFMKTDCQKRPRRQEGTIIKVIWAPTGHTSFVCNRNKLQYLSNVCRRFNGGVPMRMLALICLISHTSWCQISSPWSQGR